MTSEEQAVSGCYKEWAELESSNSNQPEATMRTLPAVFAVATLAVVLVSAQNNSKLDNIDVDAVLRNPRLFNSYLNCVMQATDKGCTAEGKELKKVLPDLVQTGCGACNEKQMERSAKVLKYITENRPKDWAELKRKYDPNGEYTAKHAEKWKKYGVTF